MFRVADPHHFLADPDPSFQVKANPYPTFFTIMRIRIGILFLIHFELQNFDFSAKSADPVPDPAFHSIADLDPYSASQNNADPSGSATLIMLLIFVRPSTYCVPTLV